MDSPLASPGGSAATTRARDRTSSSAGSGASPSFATVAPKIDLPKGGGAIRGIGEKFAANPVTGTSSMSVPIATSPGCSGFGPQLSRSDDPGAGNGPFGFGWSLLLPSSLRKTDNGLPQYLDAVDMDVYIHWASCHLTGSCEFNQDVGIVPSALAWNANSGVCPTRHLETASSGFPSRS